MQDDADEVMIAPAAEQGESKKKKKKKKAAAQGAAAAVAGEEEALPSAEALPPPADPEALGLPAAPALAAAPSTSGGSNAKSASQIKREKQKAAAARKKAAAELAASAPDVTQFFCSRYPDGLEGMDRDRAAVDAAREAGIARYTELKSAGLEPPQIEQAMAHNEGGLVVPAHNGQLSFEAATAALLGMSGISARSVEPSDALRVLLFCAKQEKAKLDDAPGNPKLLLPALKFCATHAQALSALLEAEDDERLGSARLHMVELLVVLVEARRAPLSAALASCKPPLMCTVAKLLSQHTSSTIFAEAALR